MIYIGETEYRPEAIQSEALANFSRKQTTPAVLYEYTMPTRATEGENAITCEIHQYSSDGVPLMSEVSWYLMITDTDIDIPIRRYIQSRLLRKI